MGNDFTARKQRRKARRGDDEESTRRIRKKKNQPRRLCRGPCFKPPALEMDSSDEDMAASGNRSKRPDSIIQQYEIGGNQGKGERLSDPSSEKKKKSSSNEVLLKKDRKKKMSTSSQLIPNISQQNNDHSVKKRRQEDAVEISHYPGIIQHFLKQSGILQPLPLQNMVWPKALKGDNLHVVAKPGSGKTLAYLLPIACRLSTMGHSMDSRPEGPLAMVLLPTRELAQQVASVCRHIKKSCGILRTSCLTGGSEKGRQIDSLKRGPHIIIATPGRLVDLLEEGNVNLGKVSIVILDEADKMLSMGFSEQIEKIRKSIRNTGAIFPLIESEVNRVALSHHDESDVDERKIQVGLYSATNPPQVSKISGFWTGNGKIINLVEVVSKTVSAKGELLTRGLQKSLQDEQGREQISKDVVQVVHVCADHKKMVKLQKHLSSIDKMNTGSRHKPRILIFANRIQTVKHVAKALLHDSQRVTEIHGEKSQKEREQAIMEFKSGKKNILVASDVAARGLHINNLPYVVNFDFPPNLETYVHRVGRTGRVDSQGHAYSFLTRSMAALAPSLLQLLESHDQQLDPNLVKLADAYQIAVEKMQEKAKENQETPTKPDLRLDGEKKRHEKALRKRKRNTSIQNEEIPDPSKNSLGPSSTNMATARKLNDKPKKVTVPLLPGKIRRIQRQMDVSGDSGSSDMEESRQVSKVSNLKPDSAKKKRKALPGRIRAKLKAQR
eukprot:jgi/Picsp_1/2429/NSC_05891-R1_protein